MNFVHGSLGFHGFIFVNMHKTNHTIRVHTEITSCRSRTGISFANHCQSDIETDLEGCRIKTINTTLAPRGSFTIALQIRPHGSFQKRYLLKDSTTSRMASQA